MAAKGREGEGNPKKSRNMDPSSIVAAPPPTEDTVQALIAHLVDPLLPSKPSLPHTPSPSKQQAVAIQMHAVVLLYNYYHRKQCPELDFLGFESFCKVAVIIRPSLLAYMKFMQRSNNKSGELDTELSISEEMVMSACNLCTELDSSREAPCIERWSVLKVAVFLVDSTKSNCLLQFSSKTQGVWSLIEKDLDIPHNNSGASFRMKSANNTQRTSARSTRKESGAVEAALEKLAFSAVEEETGIDLKYLTIVESHVVYSLSREKGASQFYLMQCSKGPDEEAIQVPIKDVISSMKGPVVCKSSNVYAVTSVVEYFHLLPYVDIISDWFSRETCGVDMDILPDSSEDVVADGNCSMERDKPCHKEGDEYEVSHRFHFTKQTTKIPDMPTLHSKHGTVSEDENGDYDMHGPPQYVCSPQVAEDPSSLAPTAELNTCQKATDSMQKIISHSHVRIVEKSQSQRSLKSSKIGVNDQIVDSMNKCCNVEIIDKKQKSDNDGPSHDVPLLPPTTICENLDKVQLVLASKGQDLLQSALRALQRKRDELCHQQRQLEDEIAVCEKKIQTIVNGGEDDFMLKIESIIDACVATFSKESIGNHTGERLPQHCKRRRLSEAVLVLHSPCQELDDICAENNWILPRYSVLPSNGGFVANVIVKGLDFEVSGDGDLKNDPPEARESAATEMLKKLRSMAEQLQ